MRRAWALPALAAAASALHSNRLPRAELGDARPTDLTTAERMLLDDASLGMVVGSPNATTVALKGEPKSGTTWLEFVLQGLLAQWCRDEQGCKLKRDGREVHAETAQRSLTYSVRSKHAIPGVGHYDGLDFTKAPHIADSEIRAKATRIVEQTPVTARWLVILRDPRDTTVSACYHKVKGCPAADAFVNEKIAAVTAWTNLRYRLFHAVQSLAPYRVKMVFYEDMRKDEVGTIMELAEFLAVRVTRHQAELVRDQTTFDAMKVLREDSVPQGTAKSGKVRSGHVGGYADELSPEAAGRATRQMCAALTGELRRRWAC